MEVALDRAYPYIAGVATATSMTRYAMYLMDGTPPTNAAELAAAVNLNDLGDIHDKSVGVLLCAETQGATLRDVGSSLVILNQTKAPVFKGGTTAVDTYFMVNPDRYSRVDGLPMDYLHGNPTFLSVYGVAWPTTYDDYEAFKLRDATTDATTVAFQLEYDTPIACTAVRYGGTSVSEATITNLELQYWDGSAWVSKQSWAITTTHNAAALGTNFALTTSVTASKFRLVFTCATAHVAVKKMKTCGLMVAAASVGNVKAPTWAIITPIGFSYYQQYAMGYGWRLIRARFGSEFNFLPAIVDTAGYNTNSKISLDANYNLLNYSFVLGNIKS